METFGRLLTAMVTPFDARGSVEYEQAKHLASALVESGSDGVVVSGTTGESPTLSREEKVRLFAAVKQTLGSRGAVIAGVGNYNTAESCELARSAEEVGVDGLLLVVPYYNKPTQEGLYHHFAAIARSTRLPCLIYNVPSRTVTNLSADTAIRLSQLENMVGIKEASGDFQQIAKIIDGCPDDFLVYSGNDGDTLPILALGGYGVISVASHLVGLQIKQMMEHFLAGRITEAAIAHRQLLPLFSALFIVSNPIPVKYAVNAVGFAVGKPRLPLMELDGQSAKTLDAVLHKYHIDLPIPKLA